MLWSAACFENSNSPAAIFARISSIILDHYTRGGHWQLNGGGRYVEPMMELRRRLDGFPDVADESQGARCEWHSFRYNVMYPLREPAEAGMLRLKSDFI